MTRRMTTKRVMILTLLISLQWLHHVDMRKMKWLILQKKRRMHTAMSLLTTTLTPLPLFYKQRSREKWLRMRLRMRCLLQAIKRSIHQTKRRTLTRPTGCYVTHHRAEDKSLTPRTKKQRQERTFWCLPKSVRVTLHQVKMVMMISTPSPSFYKQRSREKPRSRKKPNFL